MQAQLDLTQKEIRILQGVADGETNKQIAGAVGTTEQTVKNMRQVIRVKLDSETFFQAIATAVRRGIID